MGKALQLISHYYNLWLGFFQTNKAHKVANKYGMNKVVDMVAVSMAGNMVDAFTAIIIKRNIMMNIEMTPQEVQKNVELILRQIYFYENCKDKNSIIGRIYRLVKSYKTQMKLVEIKQMSLLIANIDIKDNSEILK